MMSDRVQFDANAQQFREGARRVIGAFRCKFASSRLLLIGFVLILILPAWCYLVFDRALAARMTTWIQIITGGVLVLSVVLWLFGKRQLRKAIADLKSLELEFCVECRAPLRGSALEGACPRCELPFHRLETRGRWKERLRHMHRHRPKVWRRWSRRWDSCLILIALVLVCLLILPFI